MGPAIYNWTLTADLKALGPVRHIIAPNWFHDLYLADYVSAYPEATLRGPRFLQKLKGRGLVGRTFDENPPWADVMSRHDVLGLLTFEEAIFFHEPSETLIVADFLMNLPTPEDAPFTRAAFTLFGANNRLCVFPLLRLALLQRNTLRRAATQIMKWKPKNVIVGHGLPIVADATPRLVKALGWLRP